MAQKFLVKTIMSFKNFRILLLTVAFCFIFQDTVQAQESVVWDQGYSYGAGGVADFGPSQKAGSTSYTLDMELADDINMVGTISRIDVRGYTNGFIQPTPSSSFYYGLNVRFYAFGTDNKPGALQAEYFIPKGSPDFLYQDNGLGDLRVRLASPFQATGRHFLTVQAVMDPFVSPGNGGATHKWYWRSTNAAEPIREEAFYFRANPAAPWGRNEPNDGSRNLSMRLWGTRILTTPPVISQISVNNLPQAGRLKITGTNFGTTQGTGMVRINGASAPVSAWTDTAITAYVSDASTIGAGSVEVITAGGTSNPKLFTVRARPSAIGRVKWRFQADDSYIQGRPAIGTDGTIYALGINGHLYALTPDGGVKWIFRGNSGAFQSVSVGADNTAYFAGFNVIYAVNADGTLKWQLVNPWGGEFDAGPNVGPDGNIYAVASFVNQTSQELGAITISPAGQILNNRPGYIHGQGGAFRTREIVFGSNQYYFGGLNNAIFSTYGLQFFALGGNYIRTVAAGDGQPAVAPDGTVYSILGANPGNPERVGAFSPTTGALLRTILTTEIRLTPPDIGADGTIYAAHNLTTLSAYTPNGAKLWDFSPASLYGSAIVNPQNTVVTVSGYDYAEPGVLYGVSNTGQSIWTVNLTAENGGYIRTTSRARFAPDGETVYYGTNVNSYANDVYSYLYAVSAAPNLPCSIGITPDFASYQYNGGSGNIAIAAVNSTCSWTAASNVNWITVYNASGTGDGNVAYTVTANPDFTPRTGTISIGGQTFTVTQGERTTATNVSITYPASGDVFTLPTNIFISANSTNPNGTIARVEFYANNEFIGTDTSAPYQIVWNDVSATNYTLTAKSIDGNGVVTLSEAVAITVYPVPPPEPAPLPIPPPTLTSPTANQQFNVGENITFSAIPGSSQYPVIRVEFYLGTSLIGSDTTSPYSFTTNTIPPGVYAVSARSVAGTGAQATSQPIDIRVVSERVSSAAPFDFDGDHKTDISIFRPSAGEWWYQTSSNGGNAAFQFGNGADKLTPGDFTGDGKTDVAFWRPSTGEWFILRSENGSYYSFPFGTSGDIPAPADFDGDGKADAAVFRATNSTWYINKSGGGTTIQQFGASGDVPAVADYDGDGKADIAIYRPSVGEWWIQKSANSNVVAFQFGNSTDRPVQGDYTGDGKADVAFYRPSTGEWFVLRSENQSYYSFPFGTSGDIPAPGDYDGDGRFDASIFRPSSSTWFVQRSTTGVLIQNFGQNGDMPVPNAFVP